MKISKNILATLLLAAVFFSSCSKNNDDDGDTLIIRPTAEDFSGLHETALEEITQTFQFNAEDGNASFTSEKGVQINIQGSCLTLNGNAVTGQVDLEFVEIFDKGNMLTTNKPTMGIMPNGDRALLLTGGEFFIEATQNGAALETSCNIQLGIPASLTGGIDNDMILWNGIIDENGDLAWEEDKRDGANGEGGVFTEGNQYYAFLGDFGWSNVDRFYNDPRPKTTILVDVPEGYDNTNCSVFLSYDGEDTGLANLDTYDAGSGLFSEHYGQIPIGLECHVIFVTEEADDWKYAIQSVTIVENDVITITDSETAVVTEAQLTAIINDLP
ncbi:hypothetical protein Q4566_06745 [Tamlana sp. 2_MG-2023]|uniref:hypothetical protein n=1 Tax=unclassified Tamlana TaxID=2614803 RepID=UPI0026E3F4AC|nr:MULTISPECIES: hypothetical protein [unclassified Tamlana]MDO6759894.1 hypothetical protein [Tamlana sp. 2_MG-2023]MDO6791936.1 hypothetical protein [Tamlana sp. 1_MG-2023]